MYGYIYLITNRRNGKVYIGQTTSTIAIRWSSHCSDASKGRKHSAFLSAIRKYGRAFFSIEELCGAESQLELDQLEEKFIASYQSTQRGIGYNIRAGGNGGGRHSSETREKLRQFNLGKPAPNLGKKMPEHQRLTMIERFRTQGHPCTGRICSEYTKRRIGEANRIKKTGTTRSLESRRKQSESMRLHHLLHPERGRKLSASRIGVPRSEETRRKISQAHMGMRMPDEIRNKIRLSLIGNVPVNKGQPMSMQQRQLISERHKGSKLTEEHKAKISSSMRSYYLSLRITDGLE